MLGMAHVCKTCNTSSILVLVSYLCSMWIHDDNIHVADPTLKMRIVKVPSDEEVLQLMRDEMERVKRNKNIFTRLFGGIKSVRIFGSQNKV